MEPKPARLPVTNSSEEKNEDSSSSDISEFDYEFKCEICDKTFSGLKPLQQHEKSSKHRKALLKQKLTRELEENPTEEDYTIEDTLFNLKPFAECRICAKEFSGPESYHQHLKSKVHHKKLVSAKLLEQITEGSKIKKDKRTERNEEVGVPPKEAIEAGAVGFSRDFEDDLSGVEKKQFECEECGKVFSGIDPLYQHLLSKAHEKSLKQKKLLEKLAENSKAINILDNVLTCELCKTSFSGPENASAHLKSKGHLKKTEYYNWKQNQLKLQVSENPRTDDDQAATANDAPLPSLGVAEEIKPLEEAISVRRETSL